MGMTWEEAIRDVAYRKGLSRAEAAHALMRAGRARDPYVKEIVDFEEGLASEATKSDPFGELVRGASTELAALPLAAASFFGDEEATKAREAIEFEKQLSPNPTMRGVGEMVGSTPGFLLTGAALGTEAVAAKIAGRLTGTAAALSKTAKVGDVVRAITPEVAGALPALAQTERVSTFLRPALDIGAYDLLTGRGLSVEGTIQGMALGGLQLALRSPFRKFLNLPPIDRAAKFLARANHEAVEAITTQQTTLGDMIRDLRARGFSDEGINDIYTAISDLNIGEVGKYAETAKALRNPFLARPEGPMGGSLGSAVPEESMWPRGRALPPEPAVPLIPGEGPTFAGEFPLQRVPQAPPRGLAGPEDLEGLAPFGWEGLSHPPTAPRPAEIIPPGTAEGPWAGLPPSSSLARSLGPFIESAPEGVKPRLKGKDPVRLQGLAQRDEDGVLHIYNPLSPVVQRLSRPSPARVTFRKPFTIRLTEELRASHLPEEAALYKLLGDSGTDAEIRKFLNTHPTSLSPSEYRRVVRTFLYDKLAKRDYDGLVVEGDIPTQSFGVDLRGFRRPSLKGELNSFLEKLIQAGKRGQIKAAEASLKEETRLGTTAFPQRGRRSVVEGEVGGPLRGAPGQIAVEWDPRLTTAVQRELTDVLGWAVSRWPRTISRLEKVSMLPPPGPYGWIGAMGKAGSMVFDPGTKAIHINPDNLMGSPNIMNRASFAHELLHAAQNILGKTGLLIRRATIAFARGPEFARTPYADALEVPAYTRTVKELQRGARELGVAGVDVVTPKQVMEGVKTEKEAWERTGEFIDWLQSLDTERLIKVFPFFMGGLALLGLGGAEPAEAATIPAPLLDQGPRFAVAAGKAVAEAAAMGSVERSGILARFMGGVAKRWEKGAPPAKTPGAAMQRFFEGMDIDDATVLLADDPVVAEFAGGLTALRYGQSLWPVSAASKHPLHHFFTARMAAAKDELITSSSSRTKFMDKEASAVLKIGNVTDAEFPAFYDTVTNLQKMPDGSLVQRWAGSSKAHQKAAVELRQRVTDPIYKDITGIHPDAPVKLGEWGLVDEARTWDRIEELQKRDVSLPLPSWVERDPNKRGWLGAAEGLKGMVERDRTHRWMKYEDSYLPIIPVENERAATVRAITELREQYGENMVNFPDVMSQMAALKIRLQQLEKIALPMRDVVPSRGFSPYMLSRNPEAVGKVMMNKNVREIMQEYIRSMYQARYMNVILSDAKELVPLLESSGVEGKEHLRAFWMDLINNQRGVRASRDNRVFQGMINAYRAVRHPFAAQLEGATSRDVEEAVSTILRIQNLTKVHMNPVRYPLMNLSGNIMTLGSLVGYRPMLRGALEAMTPEGRALAEAAHVLRGETPFRAEIEHLRPTAKNIAERGLEYLPAKTEDFNRASAFLTGYRQVMEAGSSFKPHPLVKRAFLDVPSHTLEERAVAYGRAMVDVTQFRYGPEGRPQAFVGSAGRRLLGQFKTFSTNYATMMIEAAEGGHWDVLARALGALFVFGGLPAVAEGVIAKTMYDYVRGEVIRKTGVVLPNDSGMTMLIEKMGLGNVPIPLDIYQSISPYNLPGFDRKQALSFIGGPTLGGITNAIMDVADPERGRGEGLKEVARTIAPSLVAGGEAIAEGMRGGETRGLGGELQARRGAIDIWTRGFNLSPSLRAQRYAYTKDIEAAIEGGQWATARALISDAREKGIYIGKDTLAALKGKATKIRKQDARGLLGAF